MDENTSNASTLFVDVWYVRFIDTLDLYDACFEGKCEQNTDSRSLGIGLRSWSWCKWKWCWMSSERDWSVETRTSTTWLTYTWTCFFTTNGRCIEHLSADCARNRTVRQWNHVGFNYTAWSALTYARQSKAGWFLFASRGMIGHLLVEWRWRTSESGHQDASTDVQQVCGDAFLSLSLSLDWRKSKRSFRSDQSAGTSWHFHSRVIMNKVLLITIILVELAILGGVIYWKFFSK